MNVAYAAMEDSGDSEPRLEIAEDDVGFSSGLRHSPPSAVVFFPGRLAPRPSDEITNASDAVESLLMLSSGISSPSSQDSADVRPRASSMSVQASSLYEVRQRASSTSLLPSARAAIRKAALSRRYSSGSSDTRSEPGLEDGGYYQFSTLQRMRERNNEASKRCRLKRRIRAETLEYQSSVLGMHNKRLKNRVARMECLARALREGVVVIKKRSGDEECQCLKTVQDMKQINKRSEDEADMCNNELLAGSKSCRDLAAESLVTEQLATCSEEEICPSSPIRIRDGPPPPNVVCPVMPTDVKQRIRTVMGFGGGCASSMNPPPPPPAAAAAASAKKTALDVLNETIVSSLNVSGGELVLVAAPPEPEPPRRRCLATGETPPGGCSGNLAQLCKLTSHIDLVTKTIATDVSAETSATEKSLINSRLKIPFWQLDDSDRFICQGHRAAIVQCKSIACAICGKHKAPTTKCTMLTITYRMSLQYHTATGSILPIGGLVCVVCAGARLKGIDFANCKVVTSREKFNLIPKEEACPSVVVSIVPAPLALKRECRSAASSPSKTSRAKSSDNNDVVGEKEPPSSSATIHPVKSEDRAAAGQSAVETIFTKISKLNEALNAINPRYKPIGFSITSIESCSPSVLHDAVMATETAISTLMSVIAPGQEAFLWKAIKPKLDEKLLKEGVQEM